MHMFSLSLSTVLRWGDPAQTRSMARICPGLSFRSLNHRRHVAELHVLIFFLIWTRIIVCSVSSPLIRRIRSVKVLNVVICKMFPAGSSSYAEWPIPYTVLYTRTLNRFKWAVNLWLPLWIVFMMWCVPLWPIIITIIIIMMQINEYAVNALKNKYSNNYYDCCNFCVIWIYKNGFQVRITLSV